MIVPVDRLATIDELIRKDFQNLRDSYFSALLFCTAIVVVGVLLEEIV